MEQKLESFILKLGKAWFLSLNFRIRSIETDLVICTARVTYLFFLLPKSAEEFVCS